MSDPLPQTLICPACARTGEACWAEPNRLDGRRRLVSLTGFEKTEGAGSGKIKITCDNCGAMQSV